MIDFTELKKDGNDFEILIRELLLSLQIPVRWSGKGIDAGEDLVAEIDVGSVFGNKKEKWLIQCKHHAHSGKAVGVGEVDLDSILQHGYSGFLLVTSTYPSSGLVKRLSDFGNNHPNITLNYWDSSILERLLLTPKEWALAQRYFPKSVGMDEFKTYSTLRPNSWVITYKDYYFHYSNRIGSSFWAGVESIKTTIIEVEELASKLPKEHLLVPRAIYYDDKHGHFTWYLDYLYPDEDYPILGSSEIRKILGDGWVKADGQGYNFDVMVNPYLKFSDHHDVNHYQYYSPYEDLFSHGRSRPKFYDQKIEYDLELLKRFNLSQQIDPNSSFANFCKSLEGISFIKVKRVINSSIESLDKFYFAFNWNDIISNKDINEDRFFSCSVMFCTTNLDKCIEMLNTFPVDMESNFYLNKKYVFLPDSGYDHDDDPMFELVIKINFGKNKFDVRSKLNSYLDTLAKRVNKYKKEIKKIKKK